MLVVCNDVTMLERLTKGVTCSHKCYMVFFAGLSKKEKEKTTQAVKATPHIN
jgi:hypothetical protein